MVLQIPFPGPSCPWESPSRRGYGMAEIGCGVGATRVGPDGGQILELLSTLKSASHTHLMRLLQGPWEGQIGVNIYFMSGETKRV